MPNTIRSVRDLRRSQIIAAARELVGERGLEGLTIGALERKLDFTRGVITYHFRDKGEIEVAVLESALEEIDRATLAEARVSQTFADRVRAVVDTKVRGMLAHREAQAILMSYWVRLPSDRRIAALNAKLFAGWRAQAVTLVRLGQSQGSVAPHVPESEFAALLVGSVLGIVLQIVFDPTRDSADALIEEAVQWVLSRCAAAPS